MLNVFYKALRTGLDLLMPVKRVRVNTSDDPWMTQQLKSLHAVGADELSPQELANSINESFLEPMEEYCLPCPLAQIPLKEDSAHLWVRQRHVDLMKYLIGYCENTPIFSLTLYVV